MSQGSKRVCAVVMAAGMGTRMKSDIPKVLHKVCGVSMVERVFATLKNTGVQLLVPVLSPQPKHEAVRETVRLASKKLPFPVVAAHQHDPQGTGHAAQVALQVITSEIANPEEWSVLFTCGDTPCLTSQTLQSLLEFHEANQSALTVMAFQAQDPTGYGRVITGDHSDFLGIREHKDCTPEELRVKTCNSGILVANLTSLAKVLPRLNNENTQGEYYLTDVPALLKAQGERISVYSGVSADEVQGVNTPEQLRICETYLKNQ